MFARTTDADYYPTLAMPALTELHEIIRENQLKPLENIDRKKIALLALGSYFTRTTGSTSRLTTIPSYTTTSADQNGAWNIKKHWQINLLKGELRPAHWGAHQTGVANCILGRPAIPSVEIPYMFTAGLSLLLIIYKKITYGPLNLRAVNRCVRIVKLLYVFLGDPLLSQCRGAGPPSYISLHLRSLRTNRRN